MRLAEALLKFIHNIRDLTPDVLHGDECKDPHTDICTPDYDQPYRFKAQDKDSVPFDGVLCTFLPDALYRSKVQNSGFVAIF